MSREWKPGDVVIGTIKPYTGDPYTTRLMLDDDYGWAEQPGDHGWRIDYPTDIRPLVVIDPEDDAQVEALADALTRVLIDTPGGGCMREGTVRAGLRLLVAPPKPEVYEHVVVSVARKVNSSLCGKVWESAADVTVVGRCPECADLAGRWTA